MRDDGLEADGGEGNKKYDFQLIKLYVGKGLKLWPISHCLKMLFQIFS